jgi:hypothetical protein
VGEAAHRLRWHIWEPLDHGTGWSGSLAIESPDDGLAWALEAFDSYREEDELAID